MKNIFPKGFLWGASTSAHQVEGNTSNQWTSWEKEHAHELAATARQRLAHEVPNFEMISDQASDPANYISGQAVNHYHRYLEDFNLIQELNMNAYRFSVEWSRIEPVMGHWDEKELEHYRKYIAELRKRRIEPILTVWHWTMPQWFVDLGGMEKRSNLKYFSRFAAKLAAEFSEVRYVIILNEPNVYASLSYQLGMWPPQRKNILLAMRVFYNLSLAHKAAFMAMKAQNDQLIIGVSANLVYGRPVSRSPLNRLVIRTGEYVTNWWLLNRIKKQLDFVGVNYYFTANVNWRFQTKNPPGQTSDLGWYLEPENIYFLLKEVYRRYHLPIMITENGLADAQDQFRQQWLVKTMAALEKALSDGMEVIGYLHWSLLDNFEWAYGWWPKFGLIEVDRQSLERRIRPSARWLAKQIANYRDN